MASKTDRFRKKNIAVTEIKYLIVGRRKFRVIKFKKKIRLGYGEIPIVKKIFQDLHREKDLFFY